MQFRVSCSRDDGEKMAYLDCIKIDFAMRRKNFPLLYISEDGVENRRLQKSH